MRLSELLEETEINFDAEITLLTDDSRLAEKGCAFFCLSGNEAHIKEASENGAAAVISETDFACGNAVKVKNIKKAFAACCDRFYGRPSEKLRLVGITGTNGKTTVSHMVKHILEYCGRKTALIGTAGNFAGEKRLFDTDFTTPLPTELYPLLSEAVGENCGFCVMEASSQALEQGRCENLCFEAAAFTNLTEDHLDYHGDIKSYAEAKAKLFEMSRKAVINFDDTHGSFFLNKCKSALTYSLKNEQADLYAFNIRPTDCGMFFALCIDGREYEMNINMFGEYSVYNSLAAVGCCVILGIPAEKCAEALESFHGVRGRAEKIPVNAPFRVFIDYAHTPDAIEKILTALRPCTSGRLISLFGCGGDREKEKRPLMAKAAAESSDFVIITSDNPRNENPYSIINDILNGLRGSETPFAVIENREKAIKFALRNAARGDTVVLCGKGHEKYQLKNGVKTEFDERKIVYKFINNE